ncbi:hypothetical protein AVEN_209985-1 [Araneus ventricosus]|uniref:Uncharacterized protein n=1 Tax=Araneus ventricosus TaxID=182803 RepID=A0A4Y2V7B5_ARAVE|nr:hypothetical protein AVEN_209985-1 [Araneus ventricosus]
MPQRVRQVCIQEASCKASEVERLSMSKINRTMIVSWVKDAKKNHKLLHRPGIEPAARGAGEHSTTEPPMPRKRVRQGKQMQKKPTSFASAGDRGPPAWRASILPLNHRCLESAFDRVKDAKNPTSFASAGNRARAARVAGEHSTTEPPMPRNVFDRCAFQKQAEVLEMERLSYV